MAAARALLRAAGAAAAPAGRAASLRLQATRPWISHNGANGIRRRTSTSAAPAAAATGGVEREERVRRALFNGTARNANTSVIPQSCILTQSR